MVGYNSSNVTRDNSVGIDSSASQAGPQNFVDLLLSFLNTVDAEAGTDRLRTIEGLSRWLVDRGMAAPEDLISPADLAEMAELRDALRETLSVSSSGGPGSESLEMLRRIAATVRLGLSVGRDGVVRLGTEEASPVLNAMASILTAVMCAQESGAWARLKVCRSPGCGWIFFDRSRNRSRRWCDMAVCGNRAKASRFRARRVLKSPYSTGERTPGV